MTDRASFVGSLALLGIEQSELLDVARAPDLAAARVRLVTLKARARSALRRLAFELHPDRTGGDPRKEALLKELNAAMAALDKLEPVAQPKRGPKTDAGVGRPCGRLKINVRVNYKE